MMGPRVHLLTILLIDKSNGDKGSLEQLLGSMSNDGLVVGAKGDTLECSNRSKISVS